MFARQDWKGQPGVEVILSLIRRHTVATVTDDEVRGAAPGGVT
jgi:hypothetical protein